MVAPQKIRNQKAPVYLFLGQDRDSKNTKIENAKNKLSASGVGDFNYDLLYAKDVSTNRLKEALNSVPVGVPRRLVVIKNPEDFSAANKEFILGYLKNPNQNSVIIFDCDESYIKKNAFLTGLSQLCQLVSFQSKRQANTFDLFNAIIRGDTRQALNELSALLAAGNKPQMIMGSIIGQFSQSRQTNKLKTYEEILETDITIKTGKVKPRLALEILIVKLSTGFKNTLGKA